MISTVENDQDQELFNRIAAAYIRKDILPAHRLARINRLEQTMSILPVSGKIDILEVGCGAGFSADYLSGRYRRYLGIDYSRELIKYANKYNLRDGVEFRATDITELKTSDRFDLVLMIGVLHHVALIPRFMESSLKFLKPLGWVVANEPNQGNPAVRIVRKIRKKVDSHYSASQRSFSGSQLIEIFEASGLSMIQSRPQGIFSTPFAEIIMPMQKVTTLMSRYACLFDKILEKKGFEATWCMSWNIIVAGQKRDLCTY